MAPLYFSKLFLINYRGDVNKEITLLCAKFSADVVNIPEVTVIVISFRLSFSVLGLSSLP